MMISQFQMVGRDLFARGLISSHGGNLSMRMGDRITITRRGSMLNCLQDSDLIETGVIRNNRATPLASSELAVHRAIYQQTQAQAIVHAHPPHATALSLTTQEIIPGCIEGEAVIGPVAVVGWDSETKTGRLADDIAQALKKHGKIVMVRGHGSFAIGQLMEEAYNFTTVLEESCQVMCLLKSMQASAVPLKGKRSAL